jgi:hypothetical protein
MPDFTLYFTGVNAYVFPSAADEPLTVVMPNATRFGASPQRNLPPHLPSLWVPGALPRHFVWERVAIEALDGNGQPIVGFGSVPSIAGDGLTVDTAHLGDPYKLACLVTVSAGNANRYGPCSAVWQGGDGSLADDALIHTLAVEVLGVSGLRLTRTSLFDGTSQQEVLSAGAMAIGNVCAQDIFGWPVNDDRPDPVDHDFEWLYELAEPVAGSPLPRVSGASCGLSASGVLDQGLKDQVDSRLTGMAGGGGCGCECQGCKAEWKA